MAVLLAGRYGFAGCPWLAFAWPSGKLVLAGAGAELVTTEIAWRMPRHSPSHYDLQLASQWPDGMPWCLRINGSRAPDRVVHHVQVRRALWDL